MNSKNQTINNWLFGQAVEMIPALLNTPSYLPFMCFQMLLVPFDWKWLSQPLVNTSRERKHWKDLGHFKESNLGHFKESNQQPSSPASERARIRAALGIQAAGTERNINPVSLGSSLQFQGEKVWQALPGFCTLNGYTQSPLTSKRPH